MKGSKTNKITKVLKLVLNEIAELYLYFLAIYLVCLLLSLFFERWKLFFNWRTFHLSIVIFGVLSLLSDKGREWILAQRKLFKFKKVFVKREKVPTVPIKRIPRDLAGLRLKMTSIKEILSLTIGVIKEILTLTRRVIKEMLILAIGLAKEILKILVLFVRSTVFFMKEIVKSLVGFAKSKIKMLAERLSGGDYLKIGITIIILTYTLYNKTGLVNFLVLAYALISILWVIESRVAAGIALLFLASCPVLLIMKKEPIAETMAIYAFYFLVICVVTQMREYLTG